MNPQATACVALFLAFTVAGGCRVDPDPVLVGQLLLPSGSGSRGVEILVTIAHNEQEARTVWVLFDDLGHFTHAFTGTLTSVTVTTGGRDIHRLEAEDLPAPDPTGRIDLGVIDLRDRLAGHRLVLRAADGPSAGVVRIGMWIGPPPVGPRGEPVSLGSRQFPPVVLGSELEWLLPLEAGEVYFLVERPDGPGRGTEWRSGQQRLFGPFTTAKFPAELVLDWGAGGAGPGLSP